MSGRLGGGAIVALLLAAFIVSLAYGVALPILPFLLERRLGPGGDIGWHTGLLTGTYTFALFLFSPIWGQVSDLWQRRGVIVTGLAGFAIALVLFAFIDSLPALYVGRFLSGAFAAAILPVGLALMADWAADDQARARLFARLNIAAIAGALAGPAVGGMLGGMWSGGMPASGAPFLIMAIAAAIATLVALWTLPRASPREGQLVELPALRARRSLRQLLFLSMLTAGALGTFEVGLALRAEQELDLSLAQTGAMFVECMLVMIVAQALIFNPWFPARHTRWVLAPAFGLLALALVALTFAGTRTELILAVGGVAGTTGVLSPAIAFWVSLSAGKLQGVQLGRQTAAASLGQAIGSASGGFLFGPAWAPGSAFFLAAAGALIGGLSAIPLSRKLALLAPAEDPEPSAQNGSPREGV